MARPSNATWRKIRRRMRRHGYARVTVEVTTHDDGRVLRGCVYDAHGRNVAGCKMPSHRRVRRALAHSVWFYGRELEPINPEYGW